MVHPLNIYCMSVTLAVLRLLRSSSSRAVQFWNMLLIVVTAGVFSPVTLVSVLQPLKKYSVDVTLFIFRLLRSMLSNDVQPLNMLPADFTVPLGLTYSSPVRVVRFLQFSNHLASVFGLTLAKEGSNTTLFIFELMADHCWLPCVALTFLPLHTLAIRSGVLLPSGVNMRPGTSWRVDCRK